MADNESLGISVLLVETSQISNISKIVRQPTRRLFAWPDKSMWLTKYVDFYWTATNVSATTVQLKDKQQWSAGQLIWSRQSIILLVLPGQQASFDSVSLIYHPMEQDLKGLIP